MSALDRAGHVTITLRGCFKPRPQPTFDLVRWAKWEEVQDPPGTQRTATFDLLSVLECVLSDR